MVVALNNQFKLPANCREAPRRGDRLSLKALFPADRLATAARSRLGASLEVLADVGHLSAAEAPSLVADRILGVFGPTESS